MLPLRFEPFHTLGDTANVVVDGSSNAATRLVLSHWPGSPTPPGVLDDLSAQIAFRALEHPDWFDGVEVVTNNHFDQDGLGSAFALIDPATAQARRDRVIDVARAGDFGTWTDRDSARLSMAIAAFADPDRTPLDRERLTGGYDDMCGYLYLSLLPQLRDLLDDVERTRDLWADEDEHLQLSLDAVADGTVHIAENLGSDLATVTVPEEWAERSVHRFTQRLSRAVHPMAVNNATDRMRVMTIQADRVTVEQRYETWVMYPSRRLAPRQDLQLLALELTALEPGNATWRGDPPSTLTPQLRVGDGDSRLSVEQVRATAERFFATAPGAWDPYAPGG